EVSGCKDIMIGRGVVANPALARMIRKERNESLSWEEMKEILFQYWLSLETDMEAKSRAGRIKQWLHYLARQYPEAERDFEIVKRFTNLEDFTKYLNKVVVTE
ncbi:tRNA dihydrouridine(16) synthase DusC, partial [Leptospira meyeri]